MRTNKTQTMKNICYLLACFLFAGCNSNPTGNKTEKADSTLTNTVSVERLNPVMDEIIPQGEVPEIIADGFEWTEGPVWLPDQNILLFSDIPSNSVFQWSEPGGVKLYLRPSGYTDSLPRGGESGSNGLLIDGDGNLILCQHGDRRIAKMDAPLDKPEPRYISVADNWLGKRFNSPNDAVFNSKGELFFTDPAYGMEGGYGDPRREINFTGVFKRSADGKVSLLTDKLTNPNGIGFSPDESKLYVANSGQGDQGYWMEYKINSDGMIDEGKLFHNTAHRKEEDKGAPDGLKVRKDGFIFATGPGGVWVFSSDGEHIGTIRTGQATSNCAFDDEGKYLYITADMYLMRIKLN
jgi:gluconolactonase